MTLGSVRRRFSVITSTSAPATRERSTSFTTRTVRRSNTGDGDSPADGDVPMAGGAASVATSARVTPDGCVPSVSATSTPAAVDAASRAIGGSGGGSDDGPTERIHAATRVRTAAAGIQSDFMATMPPRVVGPRVSASAAAVSASGASAAIHWERAPWRRSSSARSIAMARLRRLLTVATGTSSRDAMVRCGSPS